MSSESTMPRLQFPEFAALMPMRGKSTFLEMGEAPRLVDEVPSAGKPGLILFRAAAGVCGVMPVDLIARKGMRPIVGLTVLHHGDELNVAGYRGVYYELFQTTIGAQDRTLLARRCPYCKEPLRIGKCTVRCPLCSEPYCEACWQELSGEQCCSRNCNFSAGPFKASEEFAGSFLRAVPVSDPTSRSSP